MLTDIQQWGCNDISRSKFFGRDGRLLDRQWRRIHVNLMPAGFRWAGLAQTLLEAPLQIKLKPCPRTYWLLQVRLFMAYRKLGIVHLDLEQSGRGVPILASHFAVRILRSCVLKGAHSIKSIDPLTGRYYRGIWPRLLILEAKFLQFVNQ